MEMTKMARQMIDFQKSFSDNTYDVMMTLWDQGTRMFSSLMAGAAWVPDENKRVVNESLGVYRKGCEDMKAILDQAFKSLQELFKDAESANLPQIRPTTDLQQ